MIVRESPKSGVKRNQPSWPPKSPHEALLSSPSGRRKYEKQLRDRSSVSPSPSKRRPMSLILPDNDTEEDDEETLQLQLQAIEARLKIKKLQKARKTAEDEGLGSSSRPGTATDFRRPGFTRRESEPEVQVPVSPVRNRRLPEEQKSPARVLLGIDKGVRAQDVSLKRAKSFTSNGAARANSRQAMDPPRPKSFSERIAESRNKEKEREEKQSRIEKSRSAGFGLSSFEGLKDRPTSRAGSSFSSAIGSSQDERSSNRSFQRMSTPRPGSHLSGKVDSSRPAPEASKASTASFGTKAKYHEIAERDNSSEAASFESFSGLHLKSREMQHTAITRTLDGKSIYTVPQILKTVKAPAYDPPDVENDYVVLGVVASKSSPLTPKNSRSQSTNNTENPHQSGKFMVLRLTDLKWEIDLYLFDTGFSQFWKLPIGTLIAVLNPEIMRPRNTDSGKFSLKLGSSDDTILEIGVARDLDFCHATRKDGKECGSWIDGRKTEYCDFHVELQVEKSKRGRMEVATMTGYGKAPGSGKNGMFGGSRVGSKGDDLRREGRYHDRYLHETMFISRGVGAASKLLDQDEQSWERGASREELHRKRLAEKEKERELAKKLGAMNNTAGADYMRAKSGGSNNLPMRGDSQLSDPFTSSAPKGKELGDDPLGLVGKKAGDVSLAPIKRKRVDSNKSNDPVGWGGAYKRGLLLSPKKQSILTTRPREASPAKKKARLLLPEKGIREPGRDSLGTMDVGLLAAMEDDDDDDLEIV
ncbi:hypothetical protein BS50DRAFT_375876 [Corynespora cassiicola Philippines]|uniref:Uncharacterized protein n=1 Tax=Corynespora cassiicola Philippines TaxID=1448308 RepID=A0A2T2NNK2_CORCC|nr:hypothetical protein BS50DRAFT_375876 [Corynespora cassiicola Philippines]